MTESRVASYSSSDLATLLISLGLKDVNIHRPFDHFDFTQGSRIIMVIGPMGSGKTEFAARIIRDAQVAQRKSAQMALHTTTKGGADRRNVFVVRNRYDRARFADNPSDSLSYRGGYIRCSGAIAEIENSFQLEEIMSAHRHYGTWIIDEASFYDQRIAFVINRSMREQELVFICPTLSLNFRRTLFNETARFLLEYATDLFPLSAYCEHPSCLRNALYSYRYYSHENNDIEMPALYFDPLIQLGGDRRRCGEYTPNYAARCREHHYLPGREYTFMTLKPLACDAIAGNNEQFEREIDTLAHTPHTSQLAAHLHTQYAHEQRRQVAQNALRAQLLAERALIYLFAEENIIDQRYLLHLIEKFNLNREYIMSMLRQNNRPVAS